MCHKGLVGNPRDCYGAVTRVPWTIHDNLLNDGQIRIIPSLVDATITNLRIDNLKVISKSSRSDWAGVIAGSSSSSTISNTYVKNSEVHAMGDVGGLVGGDVMSKVNKCVVDNIYVNNNNDESHRGTGAGGLVGRGEATKSETAQ